MNSNKETKIWVVSDTHFNHENIKKYEGRPDNFNEIIIKNWQDRVGSADLVIHLGDVIFNRPSELAGIMQQLPGIKILCRGNHDQNPFDWYLKRGFDAVVDYFVYEDLAFSHAPITPLPPQTHKNDGTPVKLNIHGHFHRGKHRNPKDNPGYQDDYYDFQYWQKNKEKYKLVQIEDDLRPFSLEELLT